MLKLFKLRVSAGNIPEVLKILMLMLCLALGLIASSAQADSAKTRVSGTVPEDRVACSNTSQERIALYGDLHAHTSYSIDAIAHGVRTLPADAYRFARGEAIPFFPLDENGNMIGSIRIGRPLDFASVTDHAEFLGETWLCNAPESALFENPLCVDFRRGGNEAQLLIGSITAMEEPERSADLCGPDDAVCIEAEFGPWQDIIRAAEEAYDRSASCSFTSFIGYEFSSTPSYANNHHNVIFRTGKVPRRPISFMDVKYDHQLWNALDTVCTADQGCDYLTIPHNSNLSNGLMLAPYSNLEKTRINKLEYARTRLRREPIMEIFQHKGSSECINGLAGIFGEPDEFCQNEQVRIPGEKRNIRFAWHKDGKLEYEDRQLTARDCQGQRGAGGILGGGCIGTADFLRSGLLVGLQEQKQIGLNPVKLGVIGSTDTHFSTPGATSEYDWQGHIGVEAEREKRLQPGMMPSGIRGNPGGLAGVWAVENSREAIFDAIKRREVFGTSGTRIKPRFFGGWSYALDACNQAELVSVGYEGGVPMGGDLAPVEKQGVAPRFIVQAMRDPDERAAPLQKIQIIKGWVDGTGKAHNKIYDVAGDADSNASVDRETGKRTGGGHALLCSTFEDPDFNALQQSYYYMRVIETPSPRWSFLDCLKFSEGTLPAVCTDPDVPQVIQEMAWTSPIWYTP